MHNLRLFKALVPLCVVSMFLAVLFLNQTMETGFRRFHLTRDHQLVENHGWAGVRIYDGPNVHKIRALGDYCWGFTDHEGVLYCMTYRGIGCIDLTDYSQKFVYEILPGREIEGGFRYFDGCLAFFTSRRNGKDRKFEVLDVATGELKTLEWDLENFAHNVWSWLFAADEDAGEHFWLFRLRDQDRIQHVYRLWENGRYEHVAESTYFPFYRHRMLITYTEDQIDLLKIEDGEFRTFKTIPNPEGYQFNSGWNRGLEKNLVPVTEIYGNRWIRHSDRRSEPRFARLDLEDFTIRALSELQTWPTEFGAGHHYLIEIPTRDSLDLNIFRLDKGEATFMKKLASFDREKTEWDLKTFETGLVLEEGRRVTVFSVPALKELKYKKLD